MTSKQRAYLISLAMKEQAIIQIGKAGLTPEITFGTDEALAARELVKLSVLRDAPGSEDLRELARTIADRTQSEVVQTIGRKIVLYRRGEGDRRQITLPRA